MFENNVGKRKCRPPAFSPFHKMFFRSTLLKPNFNFSGKPIFIFSSANASNLDKCIILSILLKAA